MIDQLRNLTTTYRVTSTNDPEQPDYYSVVVYPKAPEPIADMRYRFDILPAWMQDAIRLLDVAGNNCEVAGLGKKLNDVYWIEAQSLDSPNQSLVK